jgi:hypothetical protein
MNLKNFILIMVIALLLNSCGLGKQEPLWQSGMFSSDGKYYAYTYSVTTIMGSKSRGGASTNYGILKTYLQVIDLTTGKHLLEEPYRSKGMLWLREVEGSYIWLQNLNISDGISTPALFDMASQKMKFDAKALQKINPEILTKSTTTFYKDTATGAVCVEAADGRKYRIAHTTGKASVASGSFERVEDKNGYCYQTNNSLKGYSKTNDTRQKIGKGGSWQNPEIVSQEDFISPQFLAVEKEGMIGESQVTFYGDYFFVLSDNSTTDKKDRQLTMLNKNTLQTQWSMGLPQADQEMNNYNKERFFMKDNQLFVANSTNVLIIDLDKGTMVNNYPLFE